MKTISSLSIQIITNFYLTLILSLYPNFIVLAGEISSDKWYLDGIKAFRNNQFSVALELFLRAENDGLSSSQLYYNLGVTYFKLEKYSLSYDNLVKATDDPEYAFLANLNAGLAANKLGNLILAKTHFNTAYSQANDERQQSLAKMMLTKLGKYKARSEIKNTFASIQLFYGYNDNISLTNLFYTLDQTKQNDNYYSVYATYQTKVISNVDIYTSVYALDYAEKNAYDFADIRLLLRYKPGNRNSVSLGVGRNYLGGETLQNIGIFSAGTEFRLSRNSMLGIRYQYNGIASVDKAYDYLSGSLQQFRMYTRLFSLPGLKTIFYYEFEFNNRNDQSGNINGIPVFISHSPNRHKLGLSTTFPINVRQKMTIDFEYIDSKYDDPSNVIDENQPIELPPMLPPDTGPSLPDIRRIDQRQKIGINWMYKFNRQFNFMIGYYLFSNQSNIDRYTYNSERIESGIVYRFR